MKQNQIQNQRTIIDEKPRNENKNMMCLMAEVYGGIGLMGPRGGAGGRGGIGGPLWKPKGGGRGGPPA